MRPRHIAAEYAAAMGRDLMQFIASMRPRHIAAEYAAAMGRDLMQFIASMRPRHIAAEYYTVAMPAAVWLTLQ